MGSVSAGVGGGCACLFFFFFNSVASMEANQRKSPLRPAGAARQSWEGCSACEPGSGQARGSGCAGGAAAAAQNWRRLPGSPGAAPPLAGKTHPPRGWVGA